MTQSSFTPRVDRRLVQITLRLAEYMDLRVVLYQEMVNQEYLLGGRTSAPANVIPRNPRTFAVVRSCTSPRIWHICGVTSKRTSACQKRLRSTKSYAFSRLMKCMDSGSLIFRICSCNRPISEIPLKVEQYRRSARCSSGSMFFLTSSRLEAWQ